MLGGGTAVAQSVSLPSAASLNNRSGAFIGPSWPVGIGVSGTNLTLDGVPHQFAGINAYELGTDWGVNEGCGGMESDQQLNDFFSSLPPHSLVRIWGFQGSMAINVNTHQIDWAPLDRVFKIAAAHQQYLILSLDDLGGICDNGHWNDPSWFDGGFRSVYNTPQVADPSGLTPLSYWDYLQLAVAHFASQPALAMWEPYSEAEASTCPPQYQPFDCLGHQTCPDEATAAQALRYFFDTVGEEIHRLDPKHPVEDGLLSGGQCGTEGSDWTYVSASPGINVLSYHDYYPAQDAIGGTGVNGEAAHFAAARALDKPIIGGELGVLAGGAGCPTPAERASDVSMKITAQLAAGASAVLPWNWELDQGEGCSYNVNPGDPLMQVLGTAVG